MMILALGSKPDIVKAKVVVFSPVIYEWLSLVLLMANPDVLSI